MKDKSKLLNEAIRGFRLPENYFMDHTHALKPDVLQGLADDDLKLIEEKEDKIEQDLRLYDILLENAKKQELLWQETRKRISEEVGLDPTSIDEWSKACYEVAKSKGWHESDQDTVYTKLLLVHSEISEAVEELRNGHEFGEIYYGENGKPEGAIIECADAVIRIMDVCEKNGASLEEAIRIKHEYNKTRPHRHGGKKI